MSEPRYSICCNALPLGELDDTPMDGKPLYTGRCSKCQDGSEFITESESDIFEAEIADFAKKLTEHERKNT